MKHQPYYSDDDPCDDWSRTPLPKPIKQQENKNVDAR